MTVHKMQCSCFSSCSLESARAFHAHLPRVVTSGSPWVAYLRAVYKADVPLPFDVSALNFFYHHDGAWARDHPDVAWPMAPCRKARGAQSAFEVGGFHRSRAEPVPVPECAAATCAKWLPSRTRFGARPRAVDHVVIVPSADGLSRGTVFFGGRGSLAPLRADFAHARATRATLQGTSLGRGLNANGTHVEVMRMHERAVNPHMAPTEGTNHYGCWWFPARGSGIWLALGRTFHLHHKSQATGQPPFREGGPSDLLGAFMRQSTPPGAPLPKRIWAYRPSSQPRPYIPSRWPELRGGSADVRIRVARLPSTESRTERFPALALALGIDTVQVQTMAGSDSEALPSEIVSTSRACMQAPEPVGTCPPVGIELRRGLPDRPNFEFCACNHTDVALGCT